MRSSYRVTEKGVYITGYRDRRAAPKLSERLPLTYVGAGSPAFLEQVRPTMTNRITVSKRRSPRRGSCFMVGFGRSLSRIRTAVAVVLLAAMVLASLPVGAIAALATPSSEGDVAARKADGLSIGVMSDPHFFPAEYQGTRAEAYQNQISGDLRLMGENEALTTGAVDQMLADDADGSRPLPKVLLVTGDLSSEGEKASHEGFAEQMARLQEAGVAVLVIPGNHDLYNDSAMTFQNDTQVKDNGTGSLWTTEEDFRSIYASMGYDEAATVEASSGTVSDIEYYVDVEPGGIADRQGGLSYIARTDSGVAFLMIDSEVYTADVNGQGKNGSTGDGMISADLMAWIQERAVALTSEGYTIVAGIHHPVLGHQATAETEFITDRVDTVDAEGNRVSDNTNAVATQLADAGIHYIFSGHMHENDVASYTTATGNVIYDMETGGLCAYPSPYRYANVYTSGDEISLDLWSIEVDEAAMNQRLDAPNGALADTSKVDVQDYEKNAMYGDKNDKGESFITRLVMRYAARYLDQLSDIPAAVQGIAGVDLYETLFGLLNDLLAEEMTVDLGDAGVLAISYSEDPAAPDASGIHLNPVSGIAAALDSFTIRKADIQTEVQSVVDQIEANYIVNGRLERELSALLENVGDVNLLNPQNPDDTSGECYTLRQLLQDMFQRHNSGNDKTELPDQMARALENLRSSELLQNKVTSVLDQTLLPLVDEILANTTINVDTLFGRNVAWGAVVKLLMGGSEPTISEALDKFGLDLTGEGGVLDGLIAQYLTDSVYNQIGGLIDAMVRGFATDSDGLDDIVEGPAVKLTASTNPEPNPTVENGALPDQIGMSLDADDAVTSRNFSWYTSTDVDDTDVQVISAEGVADAAAAEKAMDAGEASSFEGDSVEANKAKVTLNLVLITDYEIVRENHHTATATVPAGDFYYRVGSSDDAYWSEPVLVDAEADPSDGYTAIVVADSQGASQADYDAYEGVLAEAEASVDGEAFALHLGDLVDDGSNENYWSWLMDTDASQSVALMPVSGNHEARQDDAALANAVAAHYNVDIPEQDTSTGIYYSFVYGDVTYIVLNTNDGDAAVGDAQKAWAADVADAAETTWTVLVTHKAPYSKGSHQSDSDVLALRGWLSAFATEHEIDLVLSGHDHTYLRTPSLVNGEEESATTQVVTDAAGTSYEAVVDPAGTTFVIPSASGTKFYDIAENDLPTAFSGQPYLPVYSLLSVEGDTLFWRSYTYDAASDTSTLYDSFAIVKGGELSAADLVERQIDALPAADAITDKPTAEAVRAEVEAARGAYEALAEDEKAQVSNVEKLEELERLIAMYQGLADGVCDLSDTSVYPDEDARREGFKAAIADSTIGTIIFPAGSGSSTAIGEYEKGLFGVETNTLENQYYTIDRDLVIRAADGGAADVRRCGIIVTNGATVLLDDVTLQSYQKTNTTPMNMVRVQDGTFMATGATSIIVNDRDGGSDLKDESWRGHAVVVGNMDMSSVAGTREVYLNTTGTIQGLRDSVVQHVESSLATDVVRIENGTYSAAWTDGNENAVNLSCQLEIDGGTFTKVTSGGDLVVNGGIIGNGQLDYALWMNDGATAYVSDIDGLVAGTSGKAVHVGAGLHVSDAALARLGEMGLSISSEDKTDTGFPVKATATGLGSGNGTIYAVDQQIVSFVELAANTEGALDTTPSGETLSATAQPAPGQTVYAYARYHVAADSALAGLVDGNIDELYAYSGYTMLVNELKTIEITPAAGNTAYIYDGEGKPFAFDKNFEVEGFTVKYLVDGFWTTETPVGAGTYDVRVTRNADDTYAAFEQTYEGGLVIAKAASKVPDIRYMVGETPGSIAILLQNGDSDYYYWSERDDKSDPTEIEDCVFEVSEEGTYYVWGAGDENHEDSELKAAMIFKVTFDDNDNVDGDEDEAATFTKGSREALVPRDQTLNSWGGLPTVAWEGHEFVQWTRPDGKKLTALSAIGENMTVTAEWKADGPALSEIVLTPDAGNTAHTYDGTAKSFSFTTDPEGVTGFAVKYSPAGADRWDETAPIDAGTYDVRVTRDADGDYAAYDQTYEGAVVIAKAAQAAPTTGYSTGWGSVKVIMQPHDGSYEWSSDESFQSGVQDADGYTFTLTDSGTYYVRAKADANHEAGAAKSISIVKVTFDDNDGVSGADEAQNAVFTKPEGSATPFYLMASGHCIGSGNMPKVSWEGHEFLRWETADGEEFTALRSVKEDLIVDAAWVSDEPTLTEITVTPDEGANKGHVYDGTGKAFSYATDPTGLDGFTVEYRAADSEGAWTEDAPVDAGSYDVRVMRAADGTYAVYSQVFEGGLEIAKATYVTPDVRYAKGSTEGTVRIILQNGDADMYYWSESDDLSDALEAENNEFVVSGAGSYYVFAPADKNHSASEVKEVEVIKVTFDDGDGIAGEETEGAVFTDGATEVLMAPGHALRSWGGMPKVAWDGHELVGWTAPDGSKVTDLTAIKESMTLTAQWNPPAPEPGPVTPAVPTADQVAQLAGISVSLHGVNELNSEDAEGAHPDVAYSAGGENALIADSFAVAEPVQDEETGAWTVQVTLDGGAYLDAYSKQYGEHYFADPEDQEGERAFTLAYDEATGAWAVAGGQDAAFAFDILCLTLRPADAEIYTGGESDTGGHFVDQYVVDGQGEAYTIAELNGLLGGQTARVAYLDGSGAEITDDTVPGTYEARIVIEGSPRSGEEAVVTVGGEQYTYALEPAELVIRSVSDSAEAERGELNVDLLASTDAASVRAALAEAVGGVVASLPAGTTVNFNGDAAVPLADTSGVTLLSDDLLPGPREDELVVHAEEQLGVEIGSADTYDFQYLDLVDENQSNAWVSSSLGTDVYWRIPEGADPSSVRVYHFTGLHRDYDADDAEVSDLIDASTVETVAVQVNGECGYASFHVDESGFSPFLMTWEQAEDPGANPGIDPERPGTDSGTDSKNPGFDLTVPDDIQDEGQAAKGDGSQPLPEAGDATPHIVPATIMVLAVAALILSLFLRRCSRR